MSYYKESQNQGNKNTNGRLQQSSKARANSFICETSICNNLELKCQCSVLELPKHYLPNAVEKPKQKIATVSLK